MSRWIGLKPRWPADLRNALEVVNCRIPQASLNIDGYICSIYSFVSFFKNDFSHLRYI